MPPTGLPAEATIEELAHFGGTSGNGHAALAALLHASAVGNPFALAIIDGKMPGMDGFAVVDRIRGNADLAKTNILMLTSGARGGDDGHCRKAGIAACLSKPAGESELLDAIVQVLRGAAVEAVRSNRINAELLHHSAAESAHSRG